MIQNRQNCLNNFPADFLMISETLHNQEAAPTEDAILGAEVQEAAAAPLEETPADLAAEARAEVYAADAAQLKYAPQVSTIRVPTKKYVDTNRLLNDPLGPKEFR